MSLASSAVSGEAAPFGKRFVAWLKTQLLRVLGVEDIQSRVVGLEHSLRQLLDTETNLLARLETKQRASMDAQTNSFTASFLTPLQKVTDNTVTLHERMSAYRSEKFLTHLSAIYPKTKTVLFVGRSYFGDNIKYAYLAFAERAEKEGCAFSFLPPDRLQYEQLKTLGLPCLPHALADYTAKDIGVLLSAKLMVLDDQLMAPNWRQGTLYALLQGIKSIQLWHGIPLKKIGLESVCDAKISDPGVAEVFASCGPFDVFIAPGTASRPDWEKRFSFRSFAPIGYPRNDIFFHDLSEQDAINVDAEVLACVKTARARKQRIILYTPTFRDCGGSAWIETAALETFAAYCDARGHLLYVNLHPGEQGATEQLRQRYPTIRFVAPGTDIYPIVKYVDMLVTDYSSLAFDFLLCDRPIIFYRPDHAAYTARSRSLIEDHDHYVCGDIAHTVDELTRAVEKATSALSGHVEDAHQNVRQALRQKLFDHDDGLAAQRLGDEIVRLLNE